MRFTHNIGFLLLGILLIAWGLVTLLGIGGLGVILAILAIAAGIFILLDR
jgi:mannose/fructose/N-acetylgalactosamine-specific phosphotransferase system component IIC